MRVIAGAKKGLDLRCGHGPRFRPTQQLVKGSIFDTIGPVIAGATFLDLFAGSGAMGIEALSRGAARAVFVEQERRILRALRTNLERCGFGPERADVRIGDAVRFLERAALAGAVFDVIFADPPYEGATAQKVVDIAAASTRPLCGLLVVEHGNPVFPGEGGAIALEKSRRFGGTRVSYFRYRKEGSADEGHDGAVSGDV